MKLEDLRLLNDSGEKKPKVGSQGAAASALKDAAASFTPVFRREDPIQTCENTVDLRGLTADEALDATDAFLDRAQHGDLACAFIIHGHGTGVLRERIRTYVATSPYVADARPGERGEGGDGVTVVWLR